ncbi:MAG: ribonuclease P protein component [Chitinophagaceae bacterium]|nr:MAG: ribonuclease P protein component [Chitinophagaceae bacterium]
MPRLPRTEKLKSRKAIDALFAGGQRFSVFPLLVWHQWKGGSEEPGVVAGFSCSKKHFKRAVHRNRVKRLMREAYRLQKTELLEAAKAQGLRGEFFFIFLDKTLPNFDGISAAMARCLKQLQKKSNEAVH